MTSTVSARRGLAVLGLLAATGLSPALSSAAPERNVRLGITKPSDQRDLTFNGPGIVGTLAVKEGDAVQAGQAIVEQDDTVDQATLAVIEIEATSRVQVEAAEAKLAFQKAELARKQKMFNQKVLNESELEEAKVEVVMAEKQVQLAEQERHQKELQGVEQRKKIALKHLASPISGVVAKINTHAGESPVADKPVMTVVQNDPLWVEVDLPVAQVKSLKNGNTLEVRYADDDKWVTGKVIFIAPVADARSLTEKIRLERPNPELRNSGFQVEVKSPENVATASEK
jgi:RND family efflux transporter MFP subunit